LVGSADHREAELDRGPGIWRGAALETAWFRAVLSFGLVFAVYANTLSNDFVWDDRLTVASDPRPLGEILTEPTGAYYRPLVMASFALERRLWGSSPLGFHATNLLCHAGVAWLVGTLALELGFDARLALLSAALFALHPVQTEAVAYISGRTDLLCALFLLLAVA
jgi:hypothetical protein